MFSTTEFEAFPTWMLWTSFVLSAASLMLFCVGMRRGRPKAPVEPPPDPPDPGSVTPPPPAPLPVAPMPGPRYNKDTERRTGFRRFGNPVEIMVCDSEFKVPPVRGWVVDRSRHGLRLSLHDKYANGTVLQIRPATA